MITYSRWVGPSGELLLWHRRFQARRSTPVQLTIAACCLNSSVKKFEIPGCIHCPVSGNILRNIFPFIPLHSARCHRLRRTWSGSVVVGLRNGYGLPARVKLFATVIRRQGSFGIPISTLTERFVIPLYGKVLRRCFPFFANG